MRFWQSPSSEASGKPVSAVVLQRLSSYTGALRSATVETSFRQDVFKSVRERRFDWRGTECVFLLRQPLQNDVRDRFVRSPRWRGLSKWHFLAVNQSFLGIWVFFDWHFQRFRALKNWLLERLYTCRFLFFSLVQNCENWPDSRAESPNLRTWKTSFFNKIAAEAWRERFGGPSLGQPPFLVRIGRS